MANLTTVEFYEDIIQELGGTLVDVELAHEDVDKSFKRARQRYIQHGTNNWRKEFVPLPVERGKFVYENIDENIHTIIKLIKPNTDFFNTEDAFSMAAYQEVFAQWGTGADQMDTLSYELMLGQMERYKRLFAYDTQFTHDKFRNTLTLLGRPRGNATWYMEAYLNLEDAEYEEVNWIRRWTVADAKQTLGQAYRKFSSLPGPSGDIQLEGASMIQEANDEKEALLEEIQNSVDGDGDYVEITFG